LGILESIRGPKDLDRLTSQELADLADEIWLFRGPEPIGESGIAALDALPLDVITQSPAYRVRASDTLGQDTLTIYERA